MDSPLPALRSSVDRLLNLCRGLDDAQLEAQSYSRDWSIADVLSHLGSGAVILRRGLEDTLSGAETPDDFAQSVWDEWNAKSPRAKADDGLVADEAVLEALEAVSPVDRARLRFPVGPLSMGFDEFAALRLNEQAFHTWDIEVVFDAGAHVPRDAAAVVVDNLGLIARFTGRPTGEPRDISVRTTDPAREFTLRLTADAVDLGAGGRGRAPDLMLPAEAFCRLVYGRLDADHAPAVTGDEAVLDTLRAVFPGP
jgi:uncharacterized protein (TIGR03083 family)